MKKHWISLAGCLALVAGQTIVQGDDTAKVTGNEPTPAAAPDPAAVVPVPPAAAPLQAVPRFHPTPEVSESSGLGFRKVTVAGGYADAERTTVRVVTDGRIVQVKRVGIGGVAQIGNVAPGAYTVLANGNEGIAAYGIYLGDGAHSVSNHVGLVPMRDAGVVMNLIQTHLEGGQTGAPALAPAPAAAEAAAFGEDDGDFEMDADGSVTGRATMPAPAGQVRTPISNLYVAFVREGQVVAQTQTDANGYFSVTGMTSGIYSVAVAGPGGFAVYSAGVTQPEAHVQARVKRLQFVAFRAARSGSSIVPANSKDFKLFKPTIVPPRPVPPPPPAPPGGGGFGGGGSGGGGGGGGGALGLLAGAGIGAGIGAALANRGNNNNTPVTPAKP